MPCDPCSPKAPSSSSLYGNPLALRLSPSPELPWSFISGEWGCAAASVSEADVQCGAFPSSFLSSAILQISVLSPNQGSCKVMTFVMLYTQRAGGMFWLLSFNFLTECFPISAPSVRAPLKNLNSCQQSQYRLVRINKNLGAESGRTRGHGRLSELELLRGRSRGDPATEETRERRRRKRKTEGKRR